MLQRDYVSHVSTDEGIFGCGNFSVEQFECMQIKSEFNSP